MLPADCNGTGGRTHPTPLFSDIEVDVDGSLILGFADRTGHQLGWHNGSLVSAAADVADVVGGDILRAYNNNGTFVLENNATAGPNTTAGANNTDGRVTANTTSKIISLRPRSRIARPPMAA